MESPMNTTRLSAAAAGGSAAFSSRYRARFGQSFKTRWLRSSSVRSLETSEASGAGARAGAGVWGHTTSQKSIARRIRFIWRLYWLRQASRDAADGAALVRATLEIYFKFPGFRRDRSHVACFRVDCANG